jgi:hypothetical protein
MSKMQHKFVEKTDEVVDVDRDFEVLKELGQGYEQLSLVDHIVQSIVSIRALFCLAFCLH